MKKQTVKKNTKINIIIGTAVTAVFVTALILLINVLGAGQDTVSISNNDVVIDKSKITSTATFIPYKANGTNMEIIAVKAPDGTIRTAFNTCQVCYDSGRGYYKQQGDELLCQNCGNRFKISQVEKEKNGCNPVPVSEADKSDNGTIITISKTVMEQNAALFGNWKKG